MKLRKVSGRLILRSAIVAITMVIVLWWILFFTLDDVYGVYGVYGYWLMVGGLYFILLIGCLLFVVRDVYIASVANKHSRITIVTRVLGALGASAAFLGLLVMAGLVLPIAIGIPMLLMAIRGIKLAQARPKVAGVLMLLAGIVPFIVIPPFVILVIIFFPFCILHNGQTLFPGLILLWSPLFLIPASVFLILGGVAAFLSARKKRHQERLASMSKG